MMRRTDDSARDARALAALLTYTEWNPALGREVVDALRAMGAAAAPALADLLAAPRRGRTSRMVAAWLLGRVGTADAARALERAGRDSDPEVARAAREALRGDTQRVEPAAA